ncbi:MAG: hypothetical protein OD918_05425 [Gammaproteobacteria bacterium]
MKINSIATLALAAMLVVTPLARAESDIGIGARHDPQPACHTHNAQTGKSEACKDPVADAAAVVVLAVILLAGLAVIAIYDSLTNSTPAIAPPAEQRVTILPKAFADEQGAPRGIGYELKFTF